MYGWYYTPPGLAKTALTFPVICWKCKKHVGIFIPIRWFWPNIWRGMCQIITEKKNHQISCNPVTVLLGYLHNVRKIKELISILLIAATIWIAQYWKQEMLPSTEEWLC